jgi:HD-GYP domain-containing protein (c-di-GMP phosphodiesterase class II)
MSMRTRSIHRSLLIRLLLAAILLSIVLGSAAYLNEWRQLNERIQERTQLSLELLKLETRRLLEAHIGSNAQSSVQNALDNLVNIMPRSAMGRFAVIIIHDTQQREFARYVSPDIAIASHLTEALLQQGLRFPAQGSEFAALLGIADTPDMPLATTIVDRQGKTIGYVNGVFLLSTEAMRELHRATLRAVAFAVAFILVTLILIYPIIRGLTQQLSDMAVHLLDANVDTIKTLGSAIAKRDSDTDAHNYRVTVYAVHMAEALHLDAKTIRALIKGAFLHDVGKIGIPDNILHKPGRLDEVEFSVMQQHVMHGLDIVNKAIWLDDAAEVVGNHHEKYDGSGYPEGLSEEAIPTEARIFAIIDVFDALTSERPYKKPFSLTASLEILRQGAGSHFDPALIAQFERLAPDLYERFANRDEAAKQELANIIKRYFQSDLGEIMQDLRQH